MEPEINQFYRRTPLQFKLYTPPLELAAKALEMSQRRYDTNFSAAIKAKQAMINALPGDQPVANAWRQENSKLINDAIKKSNGDYSQITQALQGLEMKLADDMAPGSKYFQINKNANDYQSWYKANQDNKDIDPENLSGYSSHFLKNYTPVGDADPSKGYQPLNLPKLPKMTDWFGDVDKSMASLKDEKFMRDITVNNPDLSTTRTQVEQSGVSKDRAFNVGMAKLMSDPYYRADRQFKAQFMSPEELVAQDRANVLRMAEGAAHATDSQSVSYGKNDNAWAWKNYGLAAQDNALARDRLDWEKDKDRRDNAPDPGEGQFSYTGYVQVPQTTLAEQGLSLSKVMSPEGQPVKKSISEA